MAAGWTVELYLFARSVLHRKLRETLAALGADAQAFGARHCQTLGKDLQQVSHNVADTQRTLQVGRRGCV